MLWNDNGSYPCVQLQREVRPLATSMSCETGALCKNMSSSASHWAHYSVLLLWGYLESNGALYTYEGEELSGAEDASKYTIK